MRTAIPHSSVWLMLPWALWLFPYVVNIGFSRDWHARPRYVAIGGLGLLGLASLMFGGAPWSPAAGMVTLVWLLYVFGHLGLSFFLSAALATPGCEMRSIPHVWTLVTGRETQEHYCPVGPLSRVDAWERRKAEALLVG